MSQFLSGKSRAALTRRHCDRLGVLFGVAAALLLLVGCGGSDPDAPTVVTPPGPQPKEDVSSDPPGDPPGGLVMPSGEIPDTESDQDPSPAQPSGGFEMPKEVTPPADDAAVAEPPSIKFASWEEIEQQVTTTGKVTVVDLWSLACEPCLKEFPGLVRLHRQYGDTVACVAVDLDYDGRKTRPPEYYQPRVADFLRSVGADFTTYISSTPNDEIYAATDIDAIPAVLVYDQQGEIVKVFADTGETQGFTYDEDIIPLVAKMAG